MCACTVYVSPYLVQPTTLTCRACEPRGICSCDKGPEAFKLLWASTFRVAGSKYLCAPCVPQNRCSCPSDRSARTDPLHGLERTMVVSELSINQMEKQKATGTSCYMWCTLVRATAHGDHSPRDSTPCTMLLANIDTGAYSLGVASNSRAMDEFLPRRVVGAAHS